jgi:hypothetical protein
VIEAREWCVGLTPAQTTVFMDNTRFRINIAGRRFGKTVLGINDCLYTSQTDLGPNMELWCIEPTYRMAEMLVWEPLKAAIPYANIAKKDESDLSIVLKNGATIRVRGAENYDSLRGPGLVWVWLDEFADMDKAVWEEVLRPALADHEGRALFTGTPKGYNWAYDLYHGATMGKPGWAAYQFTTAQGGNVTTEELASARSEMDPRIYRQEFEASFESLHGRVYSNYSRAPFPEGNIDPTIQDRGRELLIGIDFNVNPMTAIVTQRVGDECEVLDAIALMSSNTEELAQALRDKYGAARVLISCPDPSGRARKSSAPVGQTDFTILQRHKIAVRADPAAPPVVDRVNAVQTMLLDAAGRRRLRIHPRCGYLTKALDGLTYKVMANGQGTSLIDKASGLDHPTDGLGYLIWQEFNLLSSRKWRSQRVAV